MFKNEHVMIEELLKFLVGEVDAKLFEPVELFSIIQHGKRKGKEQKLLISIRIKEFI